MNNSNRDSIDTFFIKLAYLYSERSTCLRRKVGCVITKDNIQLSGGYNGVPTKLPHCKHCLRQELNIPSGKNQELCVAAHAEQNAIVQAARHGISIEGATLYCTTKPCITCAKMIVNAGIKRIVFKEDYNKELDELTKFILQNIIVDKIEDDKIIRIIGEEQ